MTGINSQLGHLLLDETGGGFIEKIIVIGLFTFAVASGISLVAGTSADTLSEQGATLANLGRTNSNFQAGGGPFAPRGGPFAPGGGPFAPGGGPFAPGGGPFAPGSQQSALAFGGSSPSATPFAPGGVRFAPSQQSALAFGGSSPSAPGGQPSGAARPGGENPFSPSFLRARLNGPANSGLLSGINNFQSGAIPGPDVGPPSFARRSRLTFASDDPSPPPRQAIGSASDSNQNSFGRASGSAAGLQGARQAIGSASASNQDSYLRPQSQGPSRGGDSFPDNNVPNNVVAPAPQVLLVVDPNGGMALLGAPNSERCLTLAGSARAACFAAASSDSDGSLEGTDVSSLSLAEIENVEPEEASEPAGTGSAVQVTFADGAHGSGTIVDLGNGNFGILTNEHVSSEPGLTGSVDANGNSLPTTDDLGGVNNLGNAENANTDIGLIGLNSSQLTAEQMGNAVPIEDIVGSPELPSDLVTEGYPQDLGLTSVETENAHINEQGMIVGEQPLREEAGRLGGLSGSAVYSFDANGNLVFEGVHRGGTPTQGVAVTAQNANAAVQLILDEDPDGDGIPTRDDTYPTVPRDQDLNNNGVIDGPNDPGTYDEAGTNVPGSRPEVPEVEQPSAWDRFTSGVAGFFGFGQEESNPTPNNETPAPTAPVTQTNNESERDGPPAPDLNHNGIPDGPNDPGTYDEIPQVSQRAQAEAERDRQEAHQEQVQAERDRQEQAERDRQEQAERDEQAARDRQQQRDRERRERERDRDPSPSTNPETTGPGESVPGRDRY